jgi:hypothetical protein
VAVICAWVGIGTVALQTTGAAFSRTTSSSGNTFQAMSAFPCTAPGTQTLISSADTYVRQNQATTNFGGAATLHVRSQNNGRNRRTLVQFVLPAIPNRCTITAATLRLNTTSLSAGRTYQAYRLASAWAETTVTWNTQPATSGAPATATTAAGWVPWTVTSIVQTMYASGNYGLLVKDQTEDAYPQATNQYSSRTGANPPQLVITFG